MPQTVVLAGLGVFEALLVLLVTLGVVAFWAVMIWAVVQLVRPRRSQPR